jgi:DNA mismatch endonuclease (patch repair protein)
MPRRDTGPELALRRELHARGLRFRVHAGNLPGRPDIVFTRAKLAVFVDGCFWHRCPLHASAPKHNAAWWEVKLSRNVERDQQKDLLLRTIGWTPLHVWEHEAVYEAADRVEATYRSSLTLLNRASTT